MKASSGKIYGWSPAGLPYLGATQIVPLAMEELGKRGPKTAESDSVLLAAIKADLAALPFFGEEPRKIWARLRVRDGIRVGRKRVLWIMRGNNLFSPFRVGAEGPLFMTAGFARTAQMRCEGPMEPGALP